MGLRSLEVNEDLQVSRMNPSRSMILRTNMNRRRDHSPQASRLQPARRLRKTTKSLPGAPPLRSPNVNSPTSNATDRCGRPPRSSARRVNKLTRLLHAQRLSWNTRRARRQRRAPRPSANARRRPRASVPRQRLRSGVKPRRRRAVRRTAAAASGSSTNASASALRLARGRCSVRWSGTGL